MPRIDITEVERLALAKAGAQSTPCTHGWRPIETAPKDETILVYGNAKTGDQAEFGQRMAVAKYAMDYNFVNLGSRPLFIYAVGHETKIDKYIWPSYWMPLPQPPEGQK